MACRPLPIRSPPRLPRVIVSNELTATVIHVVYGRQSICGGGMGYGTGNAGDPCADGATRFCLMFRVCIARIHGRVFV